MRTLLSLALLPLLACGGNSPAPAPSSPPPAPAPAPAPPPPPEPGINAGTWLVGSEVAPGRYFTDPDDGCYWERLSGLSGTLGDILANDFVAFDSRQLIVDIASSDYAFSTDEDCGRWTGTPEPSPASGTIPPGAWLVGNQVPAGTYAAEAGDGCYWARLAGFSGELEDIHANDFVAEGGRILVELLSEDAGFSTNGDCGTWNRVTGSSGLVAPGATFAARIEANRQANRRH